MFLGTVEDLFSRRLLGFALSDRHPTAELAELAAPPRAPDPPGNPQ